MTDKNLIKGISVCHPVEADKEYLLYTVDYAAKNGFDHIQYGGPMHNLVKGNIDGMTMYRKYSEFNSKKDYDYVKLSMDALSCAAAKAKENGIKMYAWHHELYLPNGFKEAYPEVLNSYGDIEVSHPLVQDFIENKIADFFDAYPDIDGIVLTLHETQVPLLKLKNQKLGKVERVKHITKILYDSCKAHGKDMIVRNFASTEEDYEMMTKAYEEISPELVVMDKWTQFDWSLTMPSNPFYAKIKKNPLFVEGDIFGEYFGKGRLPFMLKEHLKAKFEYCSSFKPLGYAVRIDRNGMAPFSDVNEVNLHILSAYLNGKDPVASINRFFETKYPHASKEVMEIMDKTEDVLIKSIYIKGYLFSELSVFPTLNHCINHYYFEMMKESCCIESNEWYIPANWQKPSADEMLREKEEAVIEAEALLKKLEILESKIEKDEYQKLWTKFANLKYVAKMWQLLFEVHMNYARYFETKDSFYERKLLETVERMLTLNEAGKKELGSEYYCIIRNRSTADMPSSFASDILKSFRLEKAAMQKLEAEQLTDYVICGGPCEGHTLQKEVNFSDTLITEDVLCRIPGNRHGMNWSAINAHGWFSYEITVKPNADNIIKVEAGNGDGMINMQVSIGEECMEISEETTGKKEIAVHYHEKSGYDKVRIRFDKISGHTPLIYTIKVC